MDNGFFEKFGSLFREQSEYVAAQEREEQEKVKEQAARIIADDAEEPHEEPKAIAESSADEESSSTSDSEIEEPDKDDIVGVGLNVSVVTDPYVKGVGNKNKCLTRLDNKFLYKPVDIINIY